MERDKGKVNANEVEQKRNRTAEHPQRPDPESDTMEGPGGKEEAPRRTPGDRNEDHRR